MLVRGLISGELMGKIKLIEEGSKSRGFSGLALRVLTCQKIRIYGKQKAPQVRSFLWELHSLVVIKI